jgi:hypothetical protein
MSDEHVATLDEDALFSPQEPQGRAPTGLRWRAIGAFLITLLVVIGVLGILPTAVISMVNELRGQEENPVYDVFTGQEIDPSQRFSGETAFVNVTVTNIDETTRIATLRISGDRICERLCPPVTGTFYSLGNESARRRGLPPSASVTVPGESGPYTFTIQLPVTGTPQRYPFDDYTLVLGAIVSAKLPNGTVDINNQKQLIENNVSMTLEDGVSRLNMLPPEPVDPAAVRSPTDPVSFVLVDRLQWQRPQYLRILTVLLVILISCSGLFALGLRTLPELVLGIGGLILGIWGVRSVVVQTPLPDVTFIDLMLGFVILVLLLALSIRATRYFYSISGLKEWWQSRQASSGAAEMPPGPPPT